MRLVQFKKDDAINVGIETPQGIINLTQIDSFKFKDMKTLLEGGNESLALAVNAMKENHHLSRKEDVQLIAPITNPEKVVCIGMNYSDHCEEIGAPLPTEPLVFSKFSSCIIPSGADIIYPKLTEKLDWEVELAFIIGRAGKYITEENAMDYVAGFTVAHDVTARDWQFKNGGQWLLGKTLDTFLPLGPALVTKDEIKDPHNLGIRTRVNGELMQNSTTQNLIFKTEKIIAYVSQFFTLSPGDVFITGTPPGVGCFRKPPVFLKVGDEVECEIDHIGSIKNRIIADTI